MSSNSKNESQILITTATEALSAKTLATFPAGGKSQGKATIFPDKPRQAFKSFGGAFNEQGWEALLCLPESGRMEAIKQIFDPKTGLGLSECRLPIGSSDYALDRYSLAEQPDDFELKSFSIERDKQCLIPYVKAAMKFQPALRLWASAWSPPPWMKENKAFDGGAFRDDPKIYDAYARYLLKFIQAYKAEGIPISMVVPQNEPGQITRYPSCDWKRGQYLVFIRDYLSPLFKAEKIDTEIWVGTINKPDFKTNIKSTLDDPTARAIVSGVGLQWWGLKILPKVRKAYPEMPIMQTETDCGNWHWKPGFNPERPQNDFTYAAYTWRKMRDFFQGGVESYMLWNIVLNETGKNLDSKRPWPQNSPVVVERAEKRVVYTPMFHMVGHFSRLLVPGARLLTSKASRGSDCFAFQNPDSTIMAHMLNDKDSARTVCLRIGDKQYLAELPPHSIATARIPSGN